MGTSAIPLLQPQVDAITEFLFRNQLTIPMLLRRTYGETPSGQSRGAGSVYPLLQGKRRVTARMARMLEKAGLDLWPFVEQSWKRDPPPETPAAAAVAAYEAARPAPRPPPAPTAAWAPTETMPRLAMALDDQGRGSLSFNLRNAPADEVLKALSVLQAAGLAAEPAPSGRAEIDDG